MATRLNAQTPDSPMPQLRYARQSNFAPDLGRFKRLDIDGRTWNVYDNANLSVHITEKCNADCPFCIAHLRYLQEGLVFVKPEIDDEQYFRRLGEILSVAKALNPSVSITGGEPTINRKLPRILQILAAANVRKRTLTTNGTGLQFKVAGSSDTVLDRLGAYRLEHLNVSRAHWRTSQNNQLMKMASHLMPDAQLAESIAQARSQGIRVRLSCVLTREGVRTVDDIARYLEWGATLGVDNFIFRQLMDFDKTRVKEGAIALFCANNQVELPPLWEQLDTDPRFELYHRVLGYYYYVEVRKYAGMDVSSEMADLRYITPQLHKFSTQMGGPTAFEMVYHPNGNLCAGWHEGENIMSEMPNV